MVESVDTPDLKSVEGNLVGVQVSLLLLGDSRISSPIHESVVYITYQVDRVHKAGSGVPAFFLVLNYTPSGYAFGISLDYT